eukprot:11198039-Lingulodinium_polyedra.AAC.1
MAPGLRWPRTLDAPARQIPGAPAGQCCTKRVPAVGVVHRTLTYGGQGEKERGVPDFLSWPRQCRANAMRVLCS